MSSELAIRGVKGWVARLGLALSLCAVPQGVRAQVKSPFLGGGKVVLQNTASDANWGHSSIEPPTGRSVRRRGVTLLALGLLRSATAVAHLVFSSPQRCGPGKRLGWSERSCKNLRLYGIAGLGLSAAFVLGGSLELGRGLWMQRRHAEWKRSHWHQFARWFLQRGAGVRWGQVGPRTR